MTSFSHLHHRVAENPGLQRLTAFTRIMLAIAFIPSGSTKLMGHPFTLLGTDTDVGAFFAGFFQAQTYYQFVGWAQVIAALLLLLPWTATLGAVIYFPIILNIFVITVSVGFEGTVYITGLMLLACTYLLCWDYPKFKYLLPERPRAMTIFSGREYLGQMIAWSLGGTGFYALLYIVNIARVKQGFGYSGFGIAALGGALFGLALAWHVLRLQSLER